MDPKTALAVSLASGLVPPPVEASAAWFVKKKMSQKQPKNDPKTHPRKTNWEIFLDNFWVNHCLTSTSLKTHIYARHPPKTLKKRSTPPPISRISHWHNKKNRLVFFLRRYFWRGGVGAVMGVMGLTTAPTKSHHPDGAAP